MGLAALLAALLGVQPGAEGAQAQTPTPAPVANEAAQTAPVAQSATPPAVESAPLGAPGIGAAGLLPASVTGLPVGIWQASDPAVLAALIGAVDVPVPAVQRLMRTLMLAEATPPAADSALSLLDARLGWLMKMGAVEEALALLAITGVDNPRLFATWVDLSLLLGDSAPVCARLATAPRLSNDLSLRVFCTARGGDWQRAALILQSARTLGDISPRRTEVLTRFLDPEMGNGRPLLPPVRPTPLEFRLFEALGEPLPTAPLPLPFATLDLAGDNGWRAQIEAAERLARVGSLPPNRLLGLYTLRRPAASGGVWDRVAALQAFEVALTRAQVNGSADTRGDAIAQALLRVWPQMASARMLPAFADLFAKDLVGADLEGRAARMARLMVFLSPGYESLSVGLTASDPETRFLTAIARGTSVSGSVNGVNLSADRPNSDSTDDASGLRLPHAEAVARGFAEGRVPQVLRDQIAQGRLGEVILRAMALFASGAEGNGGDLSDALATFRALGLEDTARRAALELMILDAQRSLR